MKSVALRVLDGPNSDRCLWVRLEQILTIGSREPADVLIEPNPGGADFLFSIGHIRVGCFVENLETASSIAVNARPVDRCRLHNGDILTAGSVRFQALIE